MSRLPAVSRCCHSTHRCRRWNPQVFSGVGAGGLRPARGAPTGTPVPRVATETRVQKTHTPWAPVEPPLGGPGRQERLLGAWPSGSLGPAPAHAQRLWDLHTHARWDK